MKVKNYLIFFLTALLCNTHIEGYGLPKLNLGLSSFLDGGPLRPRPGFYWQELLVYYTTHRLLDATGQLLGGVPSPQIRDLALINSIAYQFDKSLLGAAPGVSASIPITFVSKVSPNTLEITDSGSGFGDLNLGVYLQWPEIEFRNGQILVYRLECDVNLPVGKSKEPLKFINPSNNFFFFETYWAGTFYFTTEWAASWRAYYLWCGTDHKTHLKAGDTFFMNFTTEYEIRPHFWIGINGYFLHQLKNNKLNGIEVPHSREQVLGIGPGFLYATSYRYDLVLFGNLYIECKVRNRPQGITAVLHFFKYFD